MLFYFIIDIFKSTQETYREKFNKHLYFEWKCQLHFPFKNQNESF